MFLTLHNKHIIFQYLYLQDFAKICHYLFITKNYHSELFKELYKLFMTQYCQKLSEKSLFKKHNILCYRLTIFHRPCKYCHNTKICLHCQKEFILHDYHQHHIICPLKMYKCFYCHKTLYKYEFKNHMKNCSNLSISCPICHNYYNKQHLVYKNCCLSKITDLTYINKNNYLLKTCPKCDICVISDNILNHIKTCYRIKIKCKKCNKKFYKSLLDKHIKTCFNCSPLTKCIKCGWIGSVYYYQKHTCLH